MKDTKIEWADHTINFWWGCSKVSPACAHCYAETMARRMGRKVFGQQVEWGAGKPRAARLENAREEALAIQRGAAKFAAKHGLRPRVFVNSMSDWLDEAVPVEWLAHLLETLHLCPAVDFMLLTKRPENWYQRVSLVDGEMAESWIDCIDMPERGDVPENIWIGTSIEDQKRADERIPALLQIPAKVRFLSCEPLLGPVDLRQVERSASDAIDPEWRDGRRGEPLVSVLGWSDELDETPPGIHWVIAGGESGPGARPSHPEWFYGLRDQCQAAGVPFFFKQWGDMNFKPGAVGAGFDHTAKKGGRLLYGREWNEFPYVTA